MCVDMSSWFWYVDLQNVHLHLSHFPMTFILNLNDFLCSEFRRHHQQIIAVIVGHCLRALLQFIICYCYCRCCCVRRNWEIGPLFQSYLHVHTPYRTAHTNNNNNTLDVFFSDLLLLLLLFSWFVWYRQRAMTRCFFVYLCVWKIVQITRLKTPISRCHNALVLSTSWTRDWHSLVSRVVRVSFNSTMCSVFGIKACCHQPHTAVHTWKSLEFMRKTDA